jgi:hypothetical protein
LAGRRKIGGDGRGDVALAVATYLRGKVVYQLRPVGVATGFSKTRVVFYKNRLDFKKTAAFSKKGGGFF